MSKGELYPTKSECKFTQPDMLENKISMEETFRNGDFILKTYLDDSFNLLYESFDALDFDKDLLPRRGELFELRSRHILGYIEDIKEALSEETYSKHQYGLNKVCFLFTVERLNKVPYKMYDISIGSTSKNFSTNVDYILDNLKHKQEKDWGNLQVLNINSANYDSRYGAERRTIEICVM